MINKIERRELFTLYTLNVVLRGTYHKPWCDGSARAANVPELSHIGILLLNGLSVIRSAKGDSAVYWADALAAQGYSLFRLDLPGLGDSEGEPWVDQLRIINEGGFAQVVSGAIDELAQRFNLTSIVLIGHCSGAVSAIYTAAVNRRCAGLVLMDPYFHLNRIKTSRILHFLRTWVSRSGFERILLRAYGCVKQAQQRGFHVTSSLPDDANRRLIRCWNHLASSGFPILILRTEQSWRQAKNIYLQHVLDLAGRNNQVSIKTIEGAHHSFANCAGRAMVRQHIEVWLKDCFSPAECGHREMAESGSAVWQTSSGS